MANGMDLSLQKALVEALVGDTNVTQYVGSDVYEGVYEGPNYPYITIGETSENDDSVQFLDGSEIFVDIHVWTKETGFEQNKRISNAVRKAIHNVEFTLDEERCVDIQHRITRTFADVDIVIKHGVVTFRALTEITSYLANET